MNSNDPGYADALVVVGPHRTGTSLAAGALHFLGVEFGSHLLPANEFNRKGHWEHRDIVAVHQELLRCAGSTWHDLKPLPRDRTPRPCVQPLRAQLARIVERDFAASKLWGFKDPRTCCLQPVWLEILDELGSQPLFVVVQRDPAAAAASLVDRDGYPLDRAYLLWLRYSLAAEANTRGRRRVLVRSEDLVTDWAHEIERIADNGVNWRRSASEATCEIEDFITPAWLRNRRAEPSTRLAWPQEIASALESAVREEDDVAMDYLDNVTSELSSYRAVLDLAFDRAGKNRHGEGEIEEWPAPPRVAESPSTALIARSLSEEIATHYFPSSKRAEVDRLRSQATRGNLQHLQQRLLEATDQLTALEQENAAAAEQTRQLHHVENLAESLQVDLNAITRRATAAEVS